MRALAVQAFLKKHRALCLSILILFVAYTLLSVFIILQVKEDAEIALKYEARTELANLAERLIFDFKTIEKYAALLSHNSQVKDIFTFPTAEAVKKADIILDRYKTITGASVVYLIDLKGKTVASSNRGSAESFVGKNYAFRPYFKSAARGKRGHFLGMGKTSGKQGFYASAPVYDKEDSTKVIGVAVIKKNLDEFEERLPKDNKIMLSNKLGIIFMATEPDWDLKSLFPANLNQKGKEYIKDQFGMEGLESVFPVHAAHGECVKIGRQKFLFLSRRITGYDWTAKSLTSTKEAANEVWDASVSAVFIFILICGMGAIFFVSNRARYLVEKERERTINAKAKFTSMVSHELRTPLAAIKSSIDMFDEGFLGEPTEDQKKLIDIAKRNIDRLARLINDILDFQKLNERSMTFDFKKEDAGKILKEAYEIMKPMAEKKNLKMILSNKLGNKKLTLDRDRMMQVLANILNNAIKFTEEGSIKIKSFADQRKAHFVIEDTGPGIREEDKRKLFDSFSQMETTKSKKMEGTGLGLAICKEIITAHNGQIWAESVLGKGAAIHFTLPLN